MNPSPELIRQVVKTACAIQQIPAPTFSEAQRAAWICARFQEEGLVDVMLDEVGNVLARLPGLTAGPPLVVSAHLDTVFPASVDLSLTQTDTRISGPGIGDNSLGLAGLFSLIWLLRERRVTLPGDLWLVANVCEEGLGDLKGMQAVVNRFGAAPFAYLVVEGMGLGEIYHRGLGVQRYRVTIATPGGHSWIDYGRPSAIHEMAQFIDRLTSLPLPSSPRTTLNVGVISGGTSVNTIASQAWMELDLRSESPSALAGLIQEVERLVAMANHLDVHCRAEVIGRRPVGDIPKNHPLVRLARDIIRGLGIRPTPGIGSTDANIPLSRGFPSICIGLTNGSGAHTLKEYIRTQALSTGIEQLFQLVTRSWDLIE